LAAFGFLLMPTSPQTQHSRPCVYATELTDGGFRWCKSFKRAFISGLATTADGLLLVALTSTDLLRGVGVLMALDTAGEERWRWSPGAQRVSAPAVAGDLTCVTVDTHRLVALDLTSGEERSRVSLPATASLSAPALTDELAIVPCRGPHLLAVGIDGTIHWQYINDESDAWLDKTPLVVEDWIFTVSSGGTVIALGAEDGAQLWHTQVGPAGKSLAAPATDGARLFVGARDGLHALALDDGAEVWHFETARKIEAAPVVHAGVVYATCHDHHLYAFDAASGKELWRYEVERRIEVPPALADCDGAPCAIIADRGGTVTAVARPLSAAEHETAGHWEKAAEAYAALGRPVRAAQLLEDHGQPLQAAELWIEADEPECAAEQYEVAGAWLQAAELWEQLKQPLRRAKALEAHAHSLETVVCSPEDRAAAWSAARRAYEVEGEVQRAAVCQGEVARHLRQPLITLDVEIDRGLVLGAWSRLQFIVRNEGHGPARKLFIRASGGQFEGQVMQTQQIFTLRKGQERARWLDVCPQAHGDSVPLRVQIEYEDYEGEERQCEHTIYIPVAREEAARNAGQIINVFVSDSGAAAVGQGAVAAGAGGMAIGGDVQGDLTCDKVSPRSELDHLRLDAAVPDKVFVDRSFDLAVAVRQLASSKLDERGLSRAGSGEVQISWPEVVEQEAYVRLRVEISAPECRVHEPKSRSFTLHPNQDSPTFYFHLIPERTGEIGIIILVYREDDCLGSARVHTLACERVIGEVEMRVMSYEFSTANKVWNTAAIRTLLTAAFNDEGLTTLCFDYFRPVYEDFSTGMSKGQKIQRLLDYCDRHGQVAKLLDYVRERNPDQYDRFQHRLRNEELE
jgi:outer membrane protein assembly factor BamB